MIRAVPEHLVDGWPLDTTLFEAANPDAALPGASRLHDLRNRRRTEHAVVGKPPTESERLDAWQDPEGRETATIRSSFPTITRSRCCAGTSKSRITMSPLPVRIPVNFARSMLGILDLVTVLDVFSHDQIHIKAHTKSQQIHLACTRNQDLFFVMDSQSMSTRQIMLVL